MSEQNFDYGSEYGGDYESGSGGVYEKDEPEFLKLIIGVDDVIEDFEHRVLRGQIKKINKQTGEEYWDEMPSGTQIINELGIRELMSRVIGRVTKVARLTYKTDEEIYKDLFYFDMSLTELIAKRSDVWDMNIEVAKAIKDAAVELVWDCVASSRDGFLSINLRSQYSRSDVSRNDSQQSKQKTFLGIPIGKK